MARRIAVVSQKGGVGKTTTALNLAVALAERERETLLVDVDPQGGIGLSLARGDTELQGLAELLMGRVGPAQAVIQTQLPTLRLLPRGRLDPTDVATYEEELSGPEGLARALESAEGHAELVVIDTPSGLGKTTRAALRLSDFALLPFQSETLALRSIVQVLKVLEYVQLNENPRLRLLGIIPTMVEKDSPKAMAVLSEIWSGFPEALETIVPRSEVFARASESGIPVSYLAGATAPEARRFQLLAEELEARMDRLAGKENGHEANPARSLL